MAIGNILIVGGSIAGISAAGELRKAGYGGRITALERDEHAPIRTPELSKKVLRGQFSKQQVKLNWNPDLEVELIRGNAESLDLSRRAVLADAGNRRLQLSFDGLVIATGADARGRAEYSRPGMCVIRRLSDVFGIQQHLATASRVTVIGAGFLGLEVAASCLMMGKNVVLVEAGKAALSGRFGAELERAVLELFAARPFEAVFNQTPRAVGPSDIYLTPSGRKVTSDLTIWCIGARPEVAWLDGSGLLIDDGLVCDELLRPVGSSNVVAAGDVVRAPNARYGITMRIEHWTSAIDQGRAAARSLLGLDAGANDAVPYVWSSIFDCKLEVAGTSLGADRREVVTREEAGWVGERYYSGARLIGAAGFAPSSDPGLFPRLRRQMAEPEAGAGPRIQRDGQYRKVGQA